MTLFLVYETARRNYPRIRSPLAFYVVAHPWLLLRLQLLHTFFVSLIVLFLPFSISVVLCLLVCRVFFCVPVLANLSTPFFPCGGILVQWIYLFALRIAVSCSLLYSVREIWFVSTCHSRQGNPCVRSPLRSRSDLDTHCFRSFRRGQHAFQRV